MKLDKHFAENVFNLPKMKKYLDRRTVQDICNAQYGAKISEKSTEKYARGVRKWALSHGVKRFAHRFQPLNNFTAGKCESLVSVNQSGNAVVKFRGKELKKGEGDASSFPNGGTRQTFEARGITQWDYFSPPFILNECLYIPTTFVSFNGETLDKKTPLLRSCAALDKQALRVLKLFGTKCNRVFAVVGAEQEYFLIDKQTYLQRSDLVYTGRTLLGNLPPKGQQMHDHYYRPPNAKILQFWQAVDEELFKLGIIVKTEHREVAPAQFELAPCYAPVNIACDQNQLIMEVLQKTADKFRLVCLLHEKPFAGLNGSGKHNNWSLLTNSDINLLEQGTSAAEHARFILFVAAIVKALDEHADLLRFSVASAANDWRLGGCEAPPQTISVFLGPLHKSLLQVLQDDSWQAGRDLLPRLHETTDRNRTSPFAFTGNKFEFRMVGSSASLADCNTILNTIVADSLQWFADKLENSQNFWQDVKLLSKQVFAENGKVIFNGNNYSDEWRATAKARNLPTFADTPQAIKCLLQKDNISLFARHKILCNREIAALAQISYENYSTAIAVEAETLWEICSKQIVPTVEKYTAMLADCAKAKKALETDFRQEISAIKKASAQNRKLFWHTCKLKNLIENLNGSPQVKAEFACNTILPQMQRVRQIADKLEQLCPKEYWPMPTCGQIIFGTND